MKIVTPQEMASIERLAYEEGYSDETFMQKAGEGIAEEIAKVSRGKRILILCGKGNNGGDALVAGSILKGRGYDITVWTLSPETEWSPLCKKNYAKLEPKQTKNLTTEEVKRQFDLIIDGFFGTGFKGTVQEPYFSAIRTVNQSEVPIFAVDIPSGLNGETGEIGQIAIKANTTYYLQLPKAGFFLKEGWSVVGNLIKVSFGLPESFIQKAKAQFELNERLPSPPIKRSRNKYQAGHVVGLAGSEAYPGAALLASYAALRGGAGIVRLFHPDTIKELLVNSPYELIKIPFSPQDADRIVLEMNMATACFVGPGLGQSPETIQLLEQVLPAIKIPTIIDADALNILAQKWINVPNQSVLTPHAGEMARLLHINRPLEINEDFIQRCNGFASERNVTLVLKGGPSWIFHPGRPILVNLTGNPSMATAGSGDVLTGLIAALAAQGVALYDATRLGVYLHGLAGDIAAGERGPLGLIASDIIEAFPKAFK